LLKYVGRKMHKGTKHERLCIYMDKKYVLAEFFSYIYFIFQL